MVTLSQHLPVTKTRSSPQNGNDSCSRTWLCQASDVTFWHVTSTSTSCQFCLKTPGTSGVAEAHKATVHGLLSERRTLSDPAPVRQFVVLAVAGYHIIDGSETRKPFQIPSDAEVRKRQGGGLMRSWFRLLHRTREGLRVLHECQEKTLKNECDANTAASSS